MNRVNLCRVEILGREYSIRSSEEEERVQEIAAYVNQKIKEVSEKSSTVSTLNVAILAAMNIANEYFQSREELSRINQRVETRSGRLIEMIEEKM